MKIFKILSFLILTLYLVLCNVYAIENNNIDSIRKEINSLTDSARVNRLISLSDSFKYKSTQIALEFAYQGLELSNKNKYTFEIGLSHQCIAEIYRVRGLYERALEDYLAALKIFTSLNTPLQIAECCNSIGNIFMINGDYTQASAYFAQALEINKKLSNVNDIALNYNNIGNAYLMQDSVDKGLSYFLVSLMIADSLKNTNEVINLLNNIGAGYYRLEEYPMAMNSFEKAARLSLQKQNLFSLAQSNLNISKVYFKTNHNSSALKFALKSHKLAISENYNLILHESELLLSQIYAVLGDYRKAYNHYVKYKALSDNIFNDKNSKKLSVIQAKYEIENIEKENQILRQRNEENKKTIQRKNRIVTISTLLIVVSIILVVLLLYFNKRFKKLNSILVTQSAELKELNSQKDKFFSFVVHNIKNPFSTIYGFSELMLKYAGQKDVDKMIRYSRYIFDSSEGIKEILGNLLEWSRLQRGNYDYNPLRLDLEGLIKDIIELNYKTASKKGITLTYKNIENKFALADRKMVYTILQNLLSNAIKYNSDNGNVIISIDIKGHFAEIAVADTGNGIPEKQLKQLFVFDPSSSAKTNGESKGAGMGLIICKELVSKNGGEITAESAPGKGSRFAFTLPLPESELTYIEGNEPGISEQMSLIKDNLISYHHLPEKLVEEINNTLLPVYNHVSKVMSVEELKDFSNSIVALGDNYKIDPLKEYGLKLLNYSDTFQFDKILKVLPEFAEIVKIINRS